MKLKRPAVPKHIKGKNAEIHLTDIDPDAKQEILRIAQNKVLKQSNDPSNEDAQLQQRQIERTERLELEQGGPEAVMKKYKYIAEHQRRNLK